MMHTFNVIKAHLSRNEIEEIHKYTLELMQKTIRVCEKHCIPYYLIEGTLLGAVRHKGFIPWDDDVDIAIPVDYIDFFVDSAKREFDESIYIIPAFSSNRKIGPCPDLTRIYKKNYPIINVSGKKMDLWIDIMWLIGMPKSFIKRNVHYWHIYFRKKMVRISEPSIIETNYWKNQRFWHRMIIKILNRIPINKLFSYKKQLNRLEKVLKKYTYFDSEYVMAFPSAYERKEIFPKEYYSAGVTGNFEGQFVNLPKEYKKILTSLYGNYMQLPPESERITSHVYSLEEVN